MTVYALDGIAPDCHAESWVAPDASVIGKIVLEEEASVWFGAVLRGDNETITVGRGSNVQELCCLHTDMGFPLTIGAHCTIGHKAMLHGCTIGDGTLIGMGATVLNGATLGTECLLGAGALVTEGKAVEAGQLAVGAPAKAVRPLDAAARAGLRASAAHYRANAVRFREGLRAL